MKAGQVGYEKEMGHIFSETRERHEPAAQREDLLTLLSLCDALQRQAAEMAGDVVVGQSGPVVEAAGIATPEDLHKARVHLSLLPAHVFGKNVLLAMGSEFTSIAGASFLSRSAARDALNPPGAGKSVASQRGASPSPIQ